jgi:hypothetical protein
VDVARAVTQPVRAETGSVSFGFLKYPVSADPATTGTVTYHNDGGSPVTLTLALTVTDPGGAAAAGTFTADASTVKVPANGSATVHLTDHPAVLATGRAGSYSGRLTATGPGGVLVQTVFGATTEPESYDVTVKLVDRNGMPASDDLFPFVSFTLLDQRGGVTGPDDPAVSGGVAKVRARKGTYAVNGLIPTQPPGRPGPENVNYSVGTVPAFVVDRARTLTLDARRARKVEADVDTPGAKPFDNGIDLGFTVTTDDGPFPFEASVDAGPADLYAIPVKGDPKTFAFGYNAILDATGHGPDRTYYLALPALGRIPADPRFRLHDTDLFQADSRYHAQGVPAAFGDRVEFPFYLPGQIAAFAPEVPVALPGRRIELHNGAPTTWSGAIFQQYLTPATRGFFEGSVQVPDTVYPTGKAVRQEWNEAVFGPDLSVPGTVNLVARQGNTILSVVSSFSPSDPGHSGNGASDLAYVRGTATLSRDGVVLGTRPSPVAASFDVPGDTGRYTLALHATRARDWTTLAPQVDTVWSFNSGPPKPNDTALPLPTVKISADFDGTDSARGGARWALNLAVRDQTGGPDPKVTSVTLAISNDDGKTWVPVKVTGDGTNRRAAFTNPPTGYVSLRVTVANAAGATLDETVLRAYRLT